MSPVVTPATGPMAFLSIVTRKRKEIHLREKHNAQRHSLVVTLTPAGSPAVPPTPAMDLVASPGIVTSLMVTSTSSMSPAATPRPAVGPVVALAPATSSAVTLAPVMCPAVALTLVMDEPCSFSIPCNGLYVCTSPCDGSCSYSDLFDIPCGYSDLSDRSCRCHDSHKSCGHSNPCEKLHSSTGESSASTNGPYKQDEKVSMKVRIFSKERSF